jgi:carboxylesterase type B
MSVITPAGIGPPNKELLTTTSEDCLFLNIWTPTLSRDDALPVLVFIHGGGFTGGSGSSAQYDGSAFAAAGAVLVTLNYRLHAFGFLDLPSFFPGTSANLGLLDQACALEWVHENIAAFGGDPARITVFGESAGAASIGSLFAVSGAPSLMRRAILQSGTPTLIQPREAATTATGRLLAQLGVASGDTDALGRLPTLDTALAAYELARSDSDEAVRYGPFVDEDVLPVQPLQAVADGAATGIDLLIGTCRDEVNLFRKWPGFEDAFPDPDLGADRDVILDVYREERPDASEDDLLSAILTDVHFAVPARAFAECQLSHSSRVWMYEWTWPTPAFGACHVVELPFLFDTFDAWGGIAGDSPPKQLADAVRAAWVRFADVGEPGSDDLDWPPYDRDARSVMLIDETWHVVEDPGAARLALW